jgi:hypothetical protein
VADRVDLVATLVMDEDFRAGHERVPQACQQEHIALLDTAVIGGIRELECEYAEIGQVLPMDPRERDGHDRTQPEEAWGDRGVLPRGSLAVVGAGDDNVAGRVAGPGRAGRIRPSIWSKVNAASFGILLR